MIKATKTQTPASKVSAAADDGAAKHIIAGTRLPDVALVATHGHPSISPASRNARWCSSIRLRERRALPNPPGWDDIPGAHGSTPEAEGFRDQYAAFQVKGYEVYGVSGQSSAEQKAFAARTGLPFQFSATKQLAFADALKLPRFETGGKSYLKPPDPHRTRRRDLSLHLSGCHTG